MRDRSQATSPTRAAALAALLSLAVGVAAIAVAGRTSPGASNVVPLTMRTPRSGFNRMVVTITVCAPGTDRCATVDDVMVDTGSTGLRLEASAVPSRLRLPAFLGPDHRPLAECLHFLHDAAWGPLYSTDLHVAGMVAADLPIQVIADDGQPQPRGCPPSNGPATSNGTLGIGPQLFDCLGACEQSASRPGVFEEDHGVWVPVGGRVAPAFRLPNPVSRLPDNPNGVVFDLPETPGDGAAEVTGSLIVGVGTAANNQLGNARMLRVGGTGRFTTLYGGTAFPDSYIDSGTETYILADDRLPRCAGLSWAFCARPRRRLGAVLIGQDGAHVPVTFAVGDYQAARDRRFGASDSLAVQAEPGSMAFVWGAPFFLGRRVFVVMDGRGAEGVDGPFYAVR